ncbi:hypothetical protein BOO91_15235 [Vibrio navarrensis]|uniref:4Fe-4S cluster-binding domain-containing protein n=1 Tax=Vibrio navarrensis TaxID=29495 RepID=A0AAJ4ICC3_9VIBR|nr:MULTISPECIES: 4Fe-4S cluster-binding domain-containing protein [Vibrio]MBE3662287.1 hypothetical protein [Vibrio navarrensis]MBE4605071.1 hypothetical protein [Vibrio navarrensis]QPL54151.1 4Fe-4S cluster-binding domain-containing protein [Vibrio navarrensis]
MRQDYGEYFNVAHIEPESHIYGPGKRYVIWLQGCSLACEGCWNQQMWSFEPEQLIHREQLLDDILQYRDIDGITLLGGEPLQQAPNTRWLLSSIRRSSGCSTVLYTGFTYSELVKRKDWALLREHCDLMITGRYSSSLRNTNLRWRGSSNQELIYLAGGRIPLEPPEDANEVEVIIDENAAIRVLGYPDSGFFGTLIDSE